MCVTSHAIRRSGLTLGEDVLITGAGPLGLLTLIATRQSGASRSIISDLDEIKLIFARQFGADETYIPKDGPVAEQIIAVHGKGCVDVAFEGTSSYKAMVDATMVLRRNGRVCVISQLKGAYPKYPVFGMDFHLGELEMISSDGGWDAKRHAR
jgi:threonine dehydrogenase-like Zn-dependent dehydrogenase